MQDVLLLNADYRPVQILHWERAICLLLQRKARLVVKYSDRVIRSQSLELAWPAVVTLVSYVSIKTGPKLNRRNLLARDRFTCAYCGTAPIQGNGQPDLGKLTLDHVVPRSRAISGRVKLPWSGHRVPVTSWENLVACCGPCNYAKADRTPAEAGFPAVHPRRPSPADILRISLSRAAPPPEWLEFLT